MLYQYWKRACANLGIEGIDLYGGTKHSTVRAMREFFCPDEIKQSTGIVWNKAFERHFQHEFEDELKVETAHSFALKTPRNGLTHSQAPYRFKESLSIKGMYEQQ